MISRLNKGEYYDLSDWSFGPLEMRMDSLVDARKIAIKCIKKYKVAGYSIVIKGNGQRLAGTVELNSNGSFVWTPANERKEYALKSDGNLGSETGQSRKARVKMEARKDPKNYKMFYVRDYEKRGQSVPRAFRSFDAAIRYSARAPYGSYIDICTTPDVSRMGEWTVSNVYVRGVNKMDVNGQDKGPWVYYAPNNYYVKGKWVKNKQ